MSTNIIEQKTQEIDLNSQLITQPSPSQPQESKISQPNENCDEILFKDNKERKRPLEIQFEEEVNGAPYKKVKLSPEEDLRRKIQNFKPFTRTQNIKGLFTNQINIPNDYSNRVEPTAKFQIVKGTFIISVALINKIIEITAQSRIDDAFILNGSITKDDIPENLKKSGYTLSSQVFNQMSKNKDYLEVDPLMNLKIVIIQEKGKTEMLRKFRFPLTQKTLSFEDIYMKKMRLLEQENHRLQYQLSEIAMDYENQLQQERKRGDLQRTQKEELLKQLQKYRKIDMQDLEAKETIDLAGVIEINDRQKYRPVVAIEQQVEEVNPEFIVKDQVMHAPVVDIDRLTVEKNYTDVVKNKDHLKMVEMMQKLGQNSASIDKNFLSLMIDIIVDEDKKKTKNTTKYIQTQPQQSKPYQKPIDISVYSKNFISGNFKAPQPPQVQILTPAKQVISERKPTVNEKQDSKAEAKRLKAEQKKKKLSDHRVEDENRERAQKQLAEFLGFNLSNKKDSKQPQKDQKHTQEEKKFKEKYFSQFQQRKNNNENTAIELQEKQQKIIEPSKNQQNNDDDIELIQDPQLALQETPKPQQQLNEDKNSSQPCEVVQLPQTPKSSVMMQDKNELAEQETDSIQILDLDNPNKQDIVSIQEQIPTITKPSVLNERRNQLPSRSRSDEVRPKQTRDIYITKVVSSKDKQTKPLKLNLNHYYKGVDPGITRQEEQELLDADRLKRMKPRLPKVYETVEYSDKRQVWKEFAACQDTNDLTLLLNEENYGSVHKIFKIDKLIGTMAWVQLFYKLRVLDLTKNNITYIEGLTNLKYLQKLDLSQNLITKMENLQGQINMRQLHLRDNKIETIDNIFHMKKLDTLGLQENCVFEINDSLGKIESLRYLYLHKNRIKRLKPCLKNLRLMGFMIYGNGMNYQDNANKDVLDYIRSTYCSVHTDDFLPS